MCCHGRTFHQNFLNVYNSWCKKLRVQSLISNYFKHCLRNSYWDTLLTFQNKLVDANSMVTVGAEHTGTAGAAPHYQTASKTSPMMLSFKIQSQKHSHLFSFHYECTCTLLKITAAAHGQICRGAWPLCLRDVWKSPASTNS